MSMAMMVAMASRKRDERGRYMEHEAGTRMESNEARMDNTPEMRRDRDYRGRYMDGGDARRMEREGYQGSYARMEPRGNGAHYWPEPHIPPHLDRPEERDAIRRMDTRMHDPHDPRYNPYGDEGSRDPHRMRQEVYGGQINYERKDGGRGNISYFKARPHEEHHAQQEREPMMGFQQRGDMDNRGFDKETAMEWVEHMEDKDGVKGGMYSWHQAQQYGRNLGITGEERLVEFYAVMNAMYSDFHAVGKKFGVDKPEFYAHLAKCFIEDPDAVEDKTRMYYECIAKKG